jgi:alpha-aminoadipic semialdehyde synthase
MRAYSDDEYRAASLPIAEDLEECPLIVGLKEIPVEVLERGKTYIYFSHVIKGQSFNMPMLQRALELGCTIVDYEKIADDRGKRLIAFGNYAGLAGMIDTLWALGRRLDEEGMESPFSQLKQASQYKDLSEAKEAIAAVGDVIASGGLSDELRPLVVGIAGYGNVSKGAQEILDLLPVTELTATQLLNGERWADDDRSILKVVFREEDTVLPLVDGNAFALQDYYDHPERYQGAFARYLPHLTVLVNCIYWEPRYPRLVTVEDMRTLYAGDPPKLRVIGDISCDVAGGIEVTVEATEPDNPIYVYDPDTGEARFGAEGRGPLLMAVDILPSELPREASAYFSNILKDFIPALVAADYRVSFEALSLPDELKRAVICHRGALTPDYQYIETYLAAARSQR